MKFTPILAAVLTSIAMRAQVSVKYYYLSPDAEGYVPATVDNIKQVAFYKGELRGGVAEYLLRTATNTKREAKFDPNMVRILIESSDGQNVIYIDKYAVAKNQENEYSVNANIFSVLESGLDMTAPPKDVISYEDWRKIRTLREEIPQKLYEDKRGGQWLNFTYGMGAGTLITLLALLIRRRRK